MATMVFADTYRETKFMLYSISFSSPSQWIKLIDRQSCSLGTVDIILKGNKNHDSCYMLSIYYVEGTLCRFLKSLSQTWNTDHFAQFSDEKIRVGEVVCWGHPDGPASNPVLFFSFQTKDATQNLQASERDRKYKIIDPNEHAQSIEFIIFDSQIIR